MLPHRALRLLGVLASASFLSCARDAPPEPRCGWDGESLEALVAPEPVWHHSAPNIIYFSPRGADLDRDGSSEIVVSGGSEIPASGQVVALDGKTGELRWEAPARQQLYGSPVFLDITNDGVDDVFVGGRNKEFIAVDGASGELLWQFPHEGISAPDGWYNFYTALFLDDLTGDGLPDLLVSNGGLDGAEAGAPRPPGHLMVLSSKDGSVVASAPTPDGEETYMSPLVVPDAGTPSPTILFGTGGETRYGGLWKTTLDDVLAGDISAAPRLVRTIMKGVIAPPALADLNQDGRLDIIVAAFTGQLIALDGVTDGILWETDFDGAETYSTPTLGRFDDDDVPDVFAVFLRGVFPDYSSAVRTLLSGRDGTILWQEEAGNFSMAGDVAVDLNGDGIDEVIFSTNDTTADESSQQQLYLLDTRRRAARPWGPPLGATVTASPWAGDLDADGCLDLVVSQVTIENDVGQAGLTGYRVLAPVPSHISWSGYLGTDFDSILTLPR
jgi:outer membrane protein assembly factor BamB